MLVFEVKLQLIDPELVPLSPDMIESQLLYPPGNGASMDTQDRLSDIDNGRTPMVMTPLDIALFLRKSASWVYKHWRELGGVKLGGSIIFPDKETLYEPLISSKRRGGGTTSPSREPDTRKPGSKRKPRPNDQRPKKERR
jgi:hypothetical protein